MKKRLWDDEFASGRWDCLDNMAQDHLYPYVEKYTRKGSVLDLGCGPGATGNELSADRYSFYTGMDISEVAIEKARRRTEQNHRCAKNEYIVSDIYIYEPARAYDVIVLGDSIYYIPERRIGSMLHRYSQYLNPGGHFIVRVREHASVLPIIENQFSVIEKQSFINPEVCVLVFRPADRT